MSANNTADLATTADPNELFLPGERQGNPKMSSSSPSAAPVPLLRPPIPGHNRNNANGPKPPKLTLGIPPSPNNRPLVNGNPVPAPANNATPPQPPQLQPPRPTGRPAPPQLRLATPKGSNAELPPEMPRMVNGRPAPPPLATTGLNEGPSRSGSYTYLDGKASGPASASSSNYSTLSFAMGLRQPQGGTPDPSSAISSVYSEREGGVPERDNSSVNGLIPDLDKLSLEKGRPLDADDLDDEGWLAASEQKKIVELGSLGEGAGGAVTRCKLKEGKTVFALKVCPIWCEVIKQCIANSTSRSLLPTLIPTLKSKLFENSISISIAPPTTSAATTVRLWTSRPGLFRFLWSSARVEVWTAFTRKSESWGVERVKRCLARSLKVF